jgi:hypothetical protein
MIKVYYLFFKLDKIRIIFRQFILLLLGVMDKIQANFSTTLVVLCLKKPLIKAFASYLTIAENTDFLLILKKCHKDINNN